MHRTTLGAMLTALPLAVLPARAQQLPADTTTPHETTASMKDDLRMLLVAEETFFRDSTTYTADIGAPALGFRGLSPRNRLLAIEASATGWTARISGPGGVCAIFVGDAKPLAPAKDEGAPACQQRQGNQLERGLRG